MRSFLLFALPALALAAPPKSPRVTSMTFSGNGCTQGSGSVTSSDVYLDDNFAATFSDLTGDSTSQCQLHVIAQGGSPGWQVAVREVTYSGNVYMRGDSEIQTLTTVYWSENAAKTVRSSAYLTIENTILIRPRERWPAVWFAKDHHFGIMYQSRAARRIWSGPNARATVAIQVSWMSTTVPLFRVITDLTTLTGPHGSWNGGSAKSR